LEMIEKTSIKICRFLALPVITKIQLTLCLSQLKYLKELGK
jgi:hypothetical protein